EGQTGGLLLTDYVKAQQQVDGETAGRILDETVQGLVAAARHDGRALLPGLGYLVADGASLMFEQLNPGGMALPPMKARFPGVAETQPDGATEPAAETTEPVAVEAVAPAETETVADGGEADDSVLAEEEPRGGRTIWWIAAAAVILLAGGM